MADRLKHLWRVPIQFADGSTDIAEITAYWDPEKPSTQEAVEVAAKVETSRREKRDCHMIGHAELVA